MSEKKINTETLELLLNTVNQETDAVFNQHNYINWLNVKATIRKKNERPNPYHRLQASTLARKFDISHWFP